MFVFTAPFIKEIDIGNPASCPFPGYDQDVAHAFVSRHGLAVRAIGIEVDDAEEAFRCVV